MKSFNYNRPYHRLNLRKHPDLYQVGKGEQGVLLVEPYKGELLPLWKFRTVAIAKRSAKALFARFRAYKKDGDFVGMDMARKFLQMGYTRARRYANHAGGRKYDKKSGKELPRSKEDPEKAAAAAVFYDFYVKAREDAGYARLKKAHQAKFG